MAEPQPRWVRAWQAARRLSWPERWLVLQAWLSLPLMQLALRWLGLARSWSALANRIPEPTRPEADGAPALNSARRTSLAVQRAARFSPFRVTCLTHSLVLWWLLGRQGIPSDLRIGVAKDAIRFQAHAWVEHEGFVLNDDEDVGQRFVPFDGLPAAMQQHRSPREWLV